MSGNRNSGRRPPTIARPDFTARTSPPSAPESVPIPPTLSPAAAAYWPVVLTQAGKHCDLTEADSQALGMLCELLATRDMVTAQKARKRFSSFTARGMRVLRIERQTGDALKKYCAMFRMDPQARAKGTRSRVNATGGPSIREFAQRKGGAGA